MSRSALLNFWPARSIPAIGQTAHRGQEILVGWESEVRTGRINRFTDDHSTHVSAVVIIGEDKGGSSKQPVEEYVGAGAGFRHWSDPEGKGNRYALVSEGEEGARRVWEYMQAEVDSRRTAPVEEVTDELASQPAPAEVAAPVPEAVLVPGDEDGDGDVDRADKIIRKKREREERERGNG
jgi:hypothetical protein